jgi:hypothetical protein
MSEETEPDTEDGWLGGATTMWWSHADAATYRTWLGEVGLEVISEEFVPEGDSGHACSGPANQAADEISDGLR